MQAHLLADKLDRVEFNAAYSSTLGRAKQVGIVNLQPTAWVKVKKLKVQTAEVILYSHHEVQLELDKRLDDRQYGQSQGREWEDTLCEAPDTEPWSR